MDLRSGVTLWSAMGPKLELGSPLVGDATCEVVILGGGVTGALAAYRLIYEGVDCLLIDRREIAAGSTAASTGLLQYEIDTPLVELIGHVGRDHAVHAYRRGLAAIDELEQLAGKLDADCGFRRRESLYFASNYCQLGALRREFSARREAGFDVDFLTRRQLADRSSIRAPGAIVSRGDAQIDPYRFTKQLIKAAISRGLRVHPLTEATKIDERADGVVVQTPQGQIRAQRIIYAAGYEAQPYLDKSRGNLDSTYALASQPGLQVSGWPDECLIWETARPYFYARRTVDGRAIIGGEDTAFRDDHARDGQIEAKTLRLVARFNKLFPGADLRPEYAWAGTFAHTKDGLAYIGQLPARPRAYFALGYGGNCITFSVIAAGVIADLHAGWKSKDAEVFRLER